MRRYAVLIALVLTLAVFGSPAAEASPITYYFGGTFDGAFGSLESLTNTPFSGLWVYDPASPNAGLAAGSFSLTTAYGSSTSTTGSVNTFLWSISTSLGLDLHPGFGGPSILSDASLMLRGPAGSAVGPDFPPDLSGWLWDYRGLEVYSRMTPEFGGAEGWIDCVSTDAGGCASAPIPEPASLLLLGTGLVGLRAWRKRRP